MLKLRYKSALFLALSLVLLPAALTHATSSPIAGGITVTPGQLAFKLVSDTDSQTLPVTVTNNYDATVNMSAEFKGIDENANLLIPTGTLDPNFASALSLSQTDVTLAAHGSTVINVQASNLNALSPGGHYATLVLTQQDVAGSALSIKAAVSLTIFVVKDPGSYQAIALNGVTTNHNLFKLPSKATLGFSNTGNVLVVPRATVLVFNHNGVSVLKKGVVNEASFPLLPGKKFQSTTTLTSLGNIWYPQRIQLEIAYRPDGASQLSIATASFWYIPPAYPVTLLVIAGLGTWYVVDRRRRGRRLVPDTETLLHMTASMWDKLLQAPKRIMVTEPKVPKVSVISVGVLTKPPKAGAKKPAKRKR